MLRDSTVLSRAQDACVARSVTLARSQHRPNNSTLSRHQKTVSRRRTSQPCHDRENSVATYFSFALKHRCRDPKGHLGTQKAPVAQRPVPTQGEPTLSQHKTQGGLSRQASPSTRAHVQVLSRAHRQACRAGVALPVATLLQCCDIKMEMGSSPPHLIPCLFFRSAYSKININ